MALFFRGLFSLLVIFLVVATVLFVDFAYKTFSVRQRDIATDAIVVLAGGRGRVEEGIRLFRAKKGKYLFLIGVDPMVRKQELFQERKGGKPRRPGGPGKCIAEHSGKCPLWQGDH